MPELLVQVDEPHVELLGRVVACFQLLERGLESLERHRSVRVGVLDARH